MIKKNLFQTGLGKSEHASAIHNFTLVELIDYLTILTLLSIVLL